MGIQEPRSNIDMVWITIGVIASLILIVIVGYFFALGIGTEEMSMMRRSSAPAVQPRPPLPLAPPVQGPRAKPTQQKAPIGSTAEAPPPGTYALGLPKMIAENDKFGAVPAQETAAYSARNIDRTIKLTVAEYQRLKTLIGNSGATAWDVGATFAAVQLPRIILGILVWLLGIFLIKRMSPRLWDADVSDSPYPSAIVLAAQLLSMALIVYGLVSA